MPCMATHALSSFIWMNLEFLLLECKLSVSCDAERNFTPVSLFVQSQTINWKYLYHYFSDAVCIVSLFTLWPLGCSSMEMQVTWLQSCLQICQILITECHSKKLYWNHVLILLNEIRKFISKRTKYYCVGYLFLKDSTCFLFS